MAGACDVAPGLCATEPPFGVVVGGWDEHAIISSAETGSAKEA